MKNYKILGKTFALSDYELLINNQAQEVKPTTLKALELFLTSNGEIVSKDKIISYVWGNIIVSDASAFKQAQAVKKILIGAGLPEDVIENIYGKGYRLRYEVTQAPNKTLALSTPNENSSKKSKLAAIYFALFIVLLLAVVGTKYYNNPVPTNNVLNSERRSSMEKLMSKDWHLGLQQVDEFLNQKEEKLSLDDRAFLYLKKGLILTRLQEFDKAIENSQLALQLYEKLNDKESQGQAHLYLADSYELHARIPGNKLKMQEHLKQAIDLFQEIGAKEKLIDSQMYLALHLRKYSNYKQAIKLYEKIIKDADEINDEIGKMMAINNLAVTYQILNDYDKAIELGEQGLQLTLGIGKGTYIASSYSFLSDLYQNNYQSNKAMEMMEQAIKFQLSNNEFSRLSPKLINLNFLLVQTYQFDKANELNHIINDYVDTLGKKGYLAILTIYQGLNEARQNHWQQAQKLLNQSFIKLNQLNFKFKKPLNQAYLALAQQFNADHFQAIENAMEVLENDKNPKQTKAIAALALAYSYDSLEKKDLSDKWYKQAQAELNPKWLFEYQLLLKFKLEQQKQSHSVLIAQTQNEIAEIDKKMAKLAESSQIKAEVFSQLKNQIYLKIQDLKKAK